jgi:ketosteroid isomerase-like protein
MKKLLMILPMVFLLCFTFICQKVEEVAEEAKPVVDVEAEKAAIQNLVREAFEAEQQKDIDAILNFFSENVVVQAPNMPQFEGIEALRNFYTEFFKVLVSIEGGSTKVEISEAGDMAWDYGWNRAAYEGPEGPFEDEGKYLEVWKKINGEWKVVAISFSSDKPAN